MTRRRRCAFQLRRGDRRLFVRSAPGIELR
jgi:hypothetical protein